MKKKFFKLGAIALTMSSAALNVNAQVGINTENPTNTLHIVGDTAIAKGGKHGQAFRLVDGNQMLDRVLVSDANGVGTWEVPFGGTRIGHTVSMQNILIPIPTVSTENTYLDPQSYVDLEPGVWRIDILSELDFPASMQTPNYAVEALLMLMPADSATVLYASGHIPITGDVLKTNCYAVGTSVGTASVFLLNKNRLVTSFFQVNCTNKTVRYRIGCGRLTITTLNGATVSAGQYLTWLPTSRSNYLYATRTVWLQ